MPGKLDACPSPSHMLISDKRLTDIEFVQTLHYLPNAGNHQHNDLTT